MSGGKGDDKGGSDSGGSGFSSSDYGDYAPPGVANLDSYPAPSGAGDWSTPDVSGLGTGWSDSAAPASSFADPSGGVPSFPVDVGGGMGMGDVSLFDSGGDSGGGFPTPVPGPSAGLGDISGANSPLAATPPPTFDGGVPTPTADPRLHSDPFPAYTPVGPAGTSGAPDIAAIQAAGGDNKTAGGIDNTPLGTTTGGAAGPSAVSAGAVGTGATGDDLSAAKKRAAGADDSGWMNTMGIKNPIGTAIAAAGMGYNMMQQQKLNQSIGKPAADLAALARDLKASTSGITPAGTAIATQGVDDLRAQAAALTPVAKTLTDAGTAATTQGTTDLRARAADVSPTGSTLRTQGAGLTGYVGTGTLPPEMQAQITQATKDAKTARISFYASRNMPTDPMKNTSLRSDLERIDRDAVIMGNQMAGDLAKTGAGLVDTGLRADSVAGGFDRGAADIGAGMTSAGLNANQLGGNMAGTAGQIGTNLVNSGIQASGLQSNAYNQLAQIDAAQTARTQQAIADMARALSGGPSNVVIPLGNTRA